MANTYTQLYVHVVFTVQDRLSMLKKEFQDRLYKYIIGILHNKKQTVIAIGGTEDHIHIFFGFTTTERVADLMQAVKRDSSKWLNENICAHKKFAWQEGFGSFTYSKTQIPNVVRYIENQEEHHKKKSFVDEYVDLLEKFEVKYDKRYIFKDVT